MNQNPQTAAKDLIALAELGNAALEYLKCEHSESHLKQRYKEIRNAYLNKLDPTGNFKFSDVVETDEFQAATGDSYEAYRLAKRKTRNAKKRMFTRYGNLPYRLKGGIES